MFDFIIMKYREDIKRMQAMFLIISISTLLGLLTFYLIKIIRIPIEPIKGAFLIYFCSFIGGYVGLLLGVLCNLVDTTLLTYESQQKHNDIVADRFEFTEEKVLTRGSWHRRKQQIKHRDEAICQYCGQYAPEGHVDHIIPLSRGGSDALSNLVWACEHCNLKKGTKLPIEIVKSKPKPIPLSSQDASWMPELKEFGITIEHRTSDGNVVEL